MISNHIRPIFIFVILFLSIYSISSQQVTDFSHVANLRSRRVDYPIRFTYINRIDKWWPPADTLAQMAVPGYSRPHAYNYVALTFWTCQKGPVDISKMWDDPIKYFGEELGKTKTEVQEFLKKKYNNAGVSIMLSAFGTDEYPTTKGLDPVVCAQRLGDYVKENNYDGVDVDYEDNKAMEKGTAEVWMIAFMRQLRSLLPYHIITHAPQAPYFSPGYMNGGYRKIHKQVGQLIDFYNIQFYNQMNTTYQTYEELFEDSGLLAGQSSVSEIHIAGGVPYEMIVIGKPAGEKDVDNSGFVQHKDLLEYLVKGNREWRWRTGVMFWQYHSDQDGTVINQISKVLKSMYYK